MLEEHDPLEALFEPKTDNAGGAAPVAEPVVEPVQADPPQEALADTGQQAEPKMVPIEALHEARRRATDAEARLADHGKPKEGAGRTAESSDDIASVFGEPPNPSEDLNGYLAWQNGVNQFNFLNLTLNTSERMARKDHGEELVGKVRTWAMEKFEQDPAFLQRVIFDPDPYDVAIREYNADQEEAQLRGLPEEVRKGLSPEELELIRSHRAKSTSEGEEGSQAGTAAVTPPRADNGQFKPATPAKRSPVAPSGSIADARSAGKGGNSGVATGPGVAIDNMFG